MLGQLYERRAGGREFQILGDVTEQLQAPNAVRYERDSKQIGIGWRP